MASLLQGSNSIDKQQITSLINDIDAADTELSRLRSAFMTRCKAPRKKIRGAMAQAKEAGLNLNAFRALVAEHRSLRQNQERIAKLDDEDADALTPMRQALGMLAETALGKAALDRAERQQKKEASLDALTPAG
jgi:hypothetical protein